MILAVVDDLMFSSKISAAAKGVQATVVFERSADKVLDRIRDEAPTLVIFDLDSGRLKPLDAIAAIKADVGLRSTRTLGYLSHVHVDLAAARGAGIDEVLARSTFSDRLGDILKSEP